MSGHRVLIDTNVFLSARNPDEEGHRESASLLDRVDAGELRALVSVVSIAEIRAGLQDHEVRTVWQAFTSHLVSSEDYSVIPVDISIAEFAGEIRRRTKLSLPDALIVATAKQSGADYIVTWDRELDRAQSVVKARAPKQVE